MKQHIALSQDQTGLKPIDVVNKGLARRYRAERRFRMMGLAAIIASLIFLTGVTIRHYFNTMHKTGKGPNWTWAVTALLFVIIAWLSTLGGTETYDEVAERPMTEFEMRFASADGFEDAYNVVQGNCSMCHAREPLWDGIRWAPKGV